MTEYPAPDFYPASAASFVYGMTEMALVAWELSLRFDAGVRDTMLILVCIAFFRTFMFQFYAPFAGWRLACLLHGAGVLQEIPLLLLTALLAIPVFRLGLWLQAEADWIREKTAEENVKTRIVEQEQLQVQQMQPAQAQEQVPSEQQRKEPNPEAFDKLVGVGEAVNTLKQALEMPLFYPKVMMSFDLKPVKGLLLYGPPGTGKTSVARAAAEYFGCAFHTVNASELARPHVGASEQQLQEIFNWARANAPAILFFDEIDAIGRKRDGMHLNRPSDVMLNVLLAEMDGFDQNTGVFVMAATNRRDVLDAALLRPGRFDRHVELGLPDLEDRKKLFAIFLENRPQKGIDINRCANLTSGFSPAAIHEVCEQAAYAGAQRSTAGFISKICQEDLDLAIKRMWPQVEQQRRDYLKQLDN